jgi:tRNA-splicing ligase RtcB (3'-phosphate/5'-hydroxy nucleic acid ligase)
MLIYKAKYNTAKVFIDSIDEETVKQIYSFLNHPAFQNSKIRIMPDTHAGKGSVIGFTMKMNEYVIPNIVGVDIGCGMAMCKIDADEIDFEKLDAFIKANIPSGFAIHSNNMKNVKSKFVTKGSLDLIRRVSKDVGQSVDAISSLGTLGGGNHFIEIDKHENDFYLIVHTGSRNFGLSVCGHHQKKAKELMKKMFIGDAYKDLEFLPLDNGGQDYINDMIVAQDYADINRMLIVEKIIEGFFGQRLQMCDIVSCVHNYIGEDMIIRKGAISACNGERVIIPLNMRDGVIIGTGKGNADWNFSAPHGAGRILSRKKAKAELAIEDFQNSMEGIYTSCISKDTIDESPMAYKDSQMIIDAIGETVDIDFIMKPVYNFKAGVE